MLKRPVGALAMAGAAIDDVTAWCLLALATAVAGSGDSARRARGRRARGAVHGGDDPRRPAAARTASRRPTTRSATCRRSGSAAIFVGVLLSAFVAQQIGIAAIFGAFVMGLIMPRRAGLTEDVSERFENFVVARPAAALLRRHRPPDGDRRAQPARCSGRHARPDRRRDRRQVARRDARRALRRLQLARLGRDRRADEHARPDRADRAQHRPRPRRHLDAALHDARRDGARDDVHGRPDPAADRPAGTSCASRSRRSCAGRARRRATTSRSPRRALDPRRAAGREEPRRAARARRAAREVDAAARAHHRPARRPGPLRDGHRRSTPASVGATIAPARRAARPSWPSAASPSARSRSRAPARRGLVRLASEERSTSSCSTAGGRCSATGSRAARSARCSTKAPCDVAVLVERPGMPRDRRRAPGRSSPSAAASTTGRRSSSAPGSRARTTRRCSCSARVGASNGGGDASRVLELRLARRAAARRASRPSRCSSTWRRRPPRATEGAGLLVIGLSERWRDEGLGPVRSEIAKAAPAPILFVRRGTRPGALAPRTGDLTEVLLVARVSVSQAGIVVSSRAMPLTPPRDSTIAVVGDGFGSLIVYSTAVYLGFRPEEITIYGPSATRSTPTSSSRSTSARPCCARSPSRTSCPPTGRRSPSSTRGRAGARAAAPLGAAPVQPGRPGHPRRGAASSPASCGWNDQRYPAKIGWLQRDDVANGDDAALRPLRRGRAASSAARST